MSPSAAHSYIIFNEYPNRMVTVSAETCDIVVPWRTEHMFKQSENADPDLQTGQDFAKQFLKQTGELRMMGV